MGNFTGNSRSEVCCRPPQNEEVWDTVNQCSSTVDVDMVEVDSNGETLLIAATPVLEKGPKATPLDLFRKVERSALAGASRAKPEKLPCEDASAYQGQMCENMRHGYGVHSLGGRVYKGEWRDDLRHGSGKQVWEDGRSYEGQFASGKMHGHGRMEWQTSLGLQVYVGQYEADYKHGQGRYRWADGSCYDGGWDMGKRHGVGFFSSTGGRRLRGQWRYDTLEDCSDGGEEPMQAEAPELNAKGREVVFAC